MKTYPAYKPTNIKWCPRIPMSWQSRPVKALFDVQLGKMLQNDSKVPLDQQVPYLRAVHVTWGKVQTENLQEMWASTTDIQQYGVKDGDLLVCEGGEVGRAGILFGTPKNCIIQNALHRVRGKGDSDIRFLMYVLYAIAGANWFAILCNKATIAHLTREKLTALSVPIPSGVEQKRIADFLDRKMRQIDELIAKKERMIELLKEERAAVINQVVTKGLNPKVKLKNSGIEWLGEVPEAWSIKKLKYVGEAIIGLTYSPDEVSSTGTLVFRSSNIQNGKIALKDNVYVNRPIKEKLIVKNGDILICSRNGSKALIGKCVYIDKKYEGNSFGAFMTVFRSKSNQFVYYVFNSTIFSFHIGSFLTSTINQLTTENLNGIIIALPPYEEQFEISKFLNERTTKIDGQVEREERSIELLKEYRITLITEAVTGKINVGK